MTFEQFSGPFEAGLVDPSNQNERQTHFEKRLEAARAAGCSIGNLSPRIVDSWVKNGWFDMFKRRYVSCSRFSLISPPRLHSPTGNAINKRTRSRLPIYPHTNILFPSRTRSFFLNFPMRLAN